MNGPRILLVIGGGIAAYKSCELVRLIRKGAGGIGGDVTCVLTEGGSKFVTAMALAALSENPVHTTLWDLKNEVEMGHIQLSRQADLIVVCPATADLMARMAAGIADDLATTLLLATDKPVLAVPAMNVRMWQHAATMRNVETLRAAGVEVMEPDVGAMACGEFGPGRLPDPEVIWRRIAERLGLPVDAPPPADAASRPQAEGEEDTALTLGGLSASLIARGRKQPIRFAPPPMADEAEDWLVEDGAPMPSMEDVPPLNLDSPLLAKKGKARSAMALQADDAPGGLAAVFDGPLKGRHVLVTAGPTHEPIDPVRYIANRSSGKQGFAIAAAAAQAGARVTLVAGPVHLLTPPGVDRVDVETAREMAAAVEQALPADVAVMVAAVADWRTANVAGVKIKKQGGALPPPLELTENPDILATVAQSPKRPPLLVGFAAETDHVLEHALEKRLRKGCDWIVANDVSGDVMGGAVNAVHIVSADGVESLAEMPKEDVGRAIVERIADAIGR